MLGALLPLLAVPLVADAQQAAPINAGPRWACRSADAQHPANVTMSGQTEHPSLHCVPINLTLTTNTGRLIVIGNPQAGASNAGGEQIFVTGPAYSGTMTVDDVNRQWVDAVRQSLAVDPGTPGQPMQVGDRWVCRPADTSHPPNATTTGGTATPLSCRAVNATIQMPSGKMMVIGHTHAVPRRDSNQETGEIAPVNTSGLTPAQMNASWNASVYRIFDIATSAAGGG